MKHKNETVPGKVIYHILNLLPFEKKKNSSIKTKEFVMTIYNSIITPLTQQIHESYAVK